MAFMRPTADYLTADEAFECACNEECADPSMLDPEDFKAGWYGYLSASGYLDRTEYTGPFDTADEAIKAVMEFYEVDENGDEPLPGGYCLLCQRTFDTDREWSDHAQGCMDVAAAKEEN